jgi:hypothetical protein
MPDLDQIPCLPCPRQVHPAPGTLTAPLAAIRAASLNENSPALELARCLVPAHSHGSGGPVLDLTIDPSLAAQHYALTILADAIRVRGGDDAGLFHGLQTLRQLLEQTNAQPPCGEILDGPTFPVRGFYHDITRGKVPTLATLKEIASTCARYKINQLQIHVEHTFAFRNHPDVWAGSDPLTHEEIRELDAHCARLHIDLVPSFSTFGHHYMLLRSPRKRHLNELPWDPSFEAYSWRDRMLHDTLDCQNPASLALMREFIEETRPLFRSKYFNICADETFDLGEGRNRQLAQRVGKGRLYVDFLKQLMACVRDTGAAPMFWADVIGHHPELLPEIPSDAIFLDWDYGPEASGHRAPLLRDAGRPFYVCSGIHGWSRWMADMRTAHANITGLAKVGAEHGALGLLNTDWGDYGHTLPWSGALYGLVLGACAGWNPREPGLASPDFNAACSRLVHGDPSGTLVDLLDAAQAASVDIWSPLAEWMQPSGRPQTPGRIDPTTGVPSEMFKRDPAGHRAALEQIEALRAKAEPILATASMPELHRREIRVMWDGLLAMVATAEVITDKFTQPSAPDSARRRSAADRLRALDRDACAVWHARNRPSEYWRIREVLVGAAERIDAFGS